MADKANAEHRDGVANEIRAVVQESLAPKEFSSGSRGYYVQSRVEVDGRRYMINVQAVEIGSKPSGK